VGELTKHITAQDHPQQRDSHVGLGDAAYSLTGRDC
jgi:hypothetical protein